MKAILLALALDLGLGDPPNALHPVAWFGRFAQAMEQRAPQNRPREELLYGTGIAASGIALAVLPALAIARVSQSWLGVIITAIALKMTFAWRALILAGENVQRELESNCVDGARSGLRSLVSRDTTRLESSHLAAAAIESLAENASDSFIAPLFYYRLFGLPGAFVYRAVNTLDSMIGYHGRYEFLGKVSARLDDALNLIPSRLTAMLITLAARLAGGSASQAWQTMRHDHIKTTSPNAGYPMSAMAGALGVRLEKIDHYCLNENGRAPQAADIHRAAKIVSVALGLGAALGVLLQILNRKSEI